MQPKSDKFIHYIHDIIKTNNFREQKRNKTFADKNRESNEPCFN